jgi:hypothetical protein
MTKIDIRKKVFVWGKICKCGHARFRHNDEEIAGYLNVCNDCGCDRFQGEITVDES